MKLKDKLLLEQLISKYSKYDILSTLNESNIDNMSESEIFDLLDEMFNKYVPASGMADTYGGEILRAFARIYYRCYNDGDVPFVGYGNETCNSSYRFLYNAGAPGFEKQYPSQSDYDEWYKHLKQNLKPFYMWISDEKHNHFFTEKNYKDSRIPTDEDLRDAMADEWEDDEIDEYYDDED